MGRYASEMRSAEEQAQIDLKRGRANLLRGFKHWKDDVWMCTKCGALVGDVDAHWGSFCGRVGAVRGESAGL